MSTIEDTPRVVQSMPEAEYHSHPAFSQSALKLLPDEPELFYGRHILHLPDPWQVKESDDIWLGACLHAIHLQGREITRIPRDVLTSNGQRRGKAWEAWEADHADELYLLPKEAARIQAMSAGLMADETIRRVLESDGRNELSLFWADDDTGLDLRARLDIHRQGRQGDLIGDLKATSIDVSDKRQVGAKIVEMKYHCQAAFYLEAARICIGRQPERFVFIFVRNRPPFNACMWALNANDVALGARWNRSALHDLKHRLTTGDWTNDRAGMVNEIELPKWAYSDDPAANPNYHADDFSEFQGESL